MDQRYKDLLDMLGRLRSRRRSMLLRGNYMSHDLMWIDWTIGSVEADLDWIINGPPF